MADHLDAATEEMKPGQPARGRLRLLVVCEGGVQTFPLPAEGVLVIGRAEDADVRVEDASISRRHARLHIGRTLQVEDLGSSNGTRVNDLRLKSGQRADLHPGESFEIGSALCVLQGGLLAAQPRRTVTHGYFEGRLADECERAHAARRPFAVLRLHVEGVVAQELEPMLAAALRPGDLLALYGPGEYEALLEGVDQSGAAAVEDSLGRALDGAGAPWRAGLAFCPADGRSAESLLAAACGRVARGGAAPPAAPVGDIVVEDPAMRRLYQLLERVAPGSINVLLLGETGVGKEVMAERLHRISPRAKRPLLRLNCAAFSESLLESELFGHERGAFTGATQTKPGLLEEAEGGTVFLDEMGELSQSLQAKLLRVLEERKVRRVGGLKAHAIDVRFVAATNRDLEGEVDAGRFRSDLYFRLNGIALTIPPLRERAGEIEPLARRFLASAAEHSNLSAAPPLAPEARQLLRAYQWPGNIRELKNVMERALLLSGGQPITPEHLPLDKMATARLPGAAAVSPAAITLTGRPRAPSVPPPAAAAPAPDAGEPTTLRRSMEEAERARIVEALARCNGNQTYAAKALGISRRALITKIEQYGLPRPRKGAPGD